MISRMEAGAFFGRLKHSKAKPSWVCGWKVLWWALTAVMLLCSQGSLVVALDEEFCSLPPALPDAYKVP